MLSLWLRGNEPQHGVRRMRSNLIDCAVHLHHETERAMLVSDTGDKRDAVWIPKSQAELADGVLTIPEWLAIEKDLI